MFSSRSIVALALVAVVGLAGTAWADSITFQDGLNGYTGTADARLWSQTPTGNGGAADTVGPLNSFFGIPSTTIRGYPALFRFDDIFSGTLSGTLIEINAATFSFYGRNSSGAASNTAFVRPMLSSWVEGTATDASDNAGGGVTYGYRGYDSSGPTYTYWGTNSTVEAGGIQDTDWQTDGAATNTYTSVAYPGPLGWVDFDITAAVIAWQDDNLSRAQTGSIAPIANNGMVAGTTATPPPEGGPIARLSEYMTDTTERPKLVIDYTVIPEPVTVALLALGSAALLLRRRRR